MFENLLQKVMELNEMPGVDVYLCVNGETQVMALSVMQNKTLVYQNRFFFSRLDNKVKEVTEHLDKMLEVADVERILHRRCDEADGFALYMFLFLW